MMIKSNGGSGSLENVVFDNFMGHANAYSLDINAFWSDETTAAGNGVQYENITFSHWHGTVANGAQRAPIQILCPSAVPCTAITLNAVYLWTESGSSEKYICENAFGSGPCVRTGSVSTYTTTATVTTMS
jgi:rhamnogalacturonan hydrolase